MAVVIIFLLAVLFVAAVWGREAAQKLFKGGATVAAVLFALFAVGIILLAINLQPPSPAQILNTGDTSARGAYYVPLDAAAAPARTFQAPATQASYRPDLGNPKIGVTVAPLPPGIGEPYGLPPGYGVFVGNVTPGTTAYIAGIQKGDYISQVDGQWIGSAEDLNHHNVGRRPGDIIVLRVLRGGQQYLVRVPLGNP